MKLWFFVEGHSEVHFVKNLMRKICFTYKQTEDILDFATTPETNRYYCHNCRGIGTIPYAIEDRGHFIQNCGPSKIIIICDKEKLPCFSGQTAIVTAINNLTIKSLAKVVIFDPMIERYYWNHSEIIVSILAKTYRDKFNESATIPPPTLPTGGHLNSLKKLFRAYDVKYHEDEFAESFFPRAPIETDIDLTISRARNIITLNNPDCVASPPAP